MTNKDQSTYCVNAYLNLSVHPNGSVKPCCMSNLEYNVANKTRLNQASILEFWNSESRKHFIQKLNTGIKVSECNACWREEAAGKDSKRIRDNRTYQNRELSEDMLPVVLDLSMVILKNCFG